MKKLVSTLLITLILICTITVFEVSKSSRSLHFDKMFTTQETNILVCSDDDGGVRGG